MAAFDTPWLTHMSSSTLAAREGDGLSSSHSSQSATHAAFSPSETESISTPSRNPQRSTVLVHEKSPLLVATPPQVTRAFAHLYPYLLVLNKLAGLLTWTTGDIWESFLLLASFWAITLYGDAVVRYAGPLVVVSGLMTILFAMKHSSSFSQSEIVRNFAGKGMSETSVSHRRSLDDIVDGVRLFTARCDILIEPFLQITIFLSKQRKAHSNASNATNTEPALLTLITRALFLTPVWIILSLPPFRIVTTKRTVLVIGTTILTWHSPAAKVSRTLLWRSRAVRRICCLITGLQFKHAREANALRRLFSSVQLRGKSRNINEGPSTLIRQESSVPKSIRFAFTLYENQRRWLGIGWTSSMLAYERPAWTDERLNPKPPKEKFKLPEVEGAHAKWRWVEGSEWEIDVGDDARGSKSSEADQGWIYYDNKWRNGKRQDGWGKYTRRRKWYRDAELVDITPASSSVSSSTTATQQFSTSSSNPTPLSPSSSRSTATESSLPPPYSQADTSSIASKSSTIDLQPESVHTKNLSPNIDDKSTTSPSQSDTASYHISATNNNGNNHNYTEGNTRSPSQKSKDKKSTSKFRKTWFGSNNNNNINTSNNNNTGFISIPKSGRRSSASNNNNSNNNGSSSSYSNNNNSSNNDYFAANGNSDKRNRSANHVPENENENRQGGEGIDDGDDDDDDNDADDGRNDRFHRDGRETVGTPMGTQEELDHYAYRRGLGEDVMMGLA